MTQPVISVEHLSKLYRIGTKEDVPDTLVGAMTNVLRAPFKNFNRLRRLDTFSSNGHSDEDSDDTLWALKDVSFEVQEGEVVGIIGRNGAGKSTLLKILSRITEPTSGRVVLRGRVSSLLEVGTGFHPELSGRENIYMNGTILGMTKREIDRKFDEIVDFSGVERFLDTPVKRYSSGMNVRLAFAVAAHLEPEILIIDEVLAVGDAEFQKKCLGKMQDVATQGRTVLFVSHNMPSVESLCGKILIMEKGKVEYLGPTSDGLQRYERRSENLESNVKAEYIIQSSTSSFLRYAAILDENNNPTSNIPVGGKFRLVVKINAQRTIQNFDLGVGIDDLSGRRILSMHTPKSTPPLPSVFGEKCIECVVNEFPLRPGDYQLKLSVSENWVEMDHVDRALVFKVRDGNLFNHGRGFHSGMCVASSVWTEVTCNKGWL